MIWQRSEIRRARHVPLKPVLDKLGYRLDQINNGNYVVRDLPQEFVIKDHYWVCTDNGSAGNSIDFLVKIRGMSFTDAMALLLS
jgi:hypothetical protein